MSDSNTQQFADAKKKFNSAVARLQRKQRALLARIKKTIDARQIDKVKDFISKQ